jgi:ABC-type bacteriocin/lantibiotic exporter with double-glycine peptidase domain
MFCMSEKSRAPMGRNEQTQLVLDCTILIIYAYQIIVNQLLFAGTLFISIIDSCVIKWFAAINIRDICDRAFVKKESCLSVVLYILENLQFN